MKSKKIIKVVIKDERLRKIRKKLRDFLKCAVKEKLDLLNKEADEAWEEANEKEEYLKIKEHENLMKAFRNSSLECRYVYIGGLDRGYYGCISQQKAENQGKYVEEIRTDLDLVWIPIYENWFCTECVREFDMESLTLEDFPDL
ncbi:MAG: hypothetical protein BAJALOKI2v1_270023 [Promethearchaeota archaeon]|nr:MAG: hypothetical protein BAJALOKI2v1_270023 [Candidatus Lokiarchaeota archaeon]